MRDFEKRLQKIEHEVCGTDALSMSFFEAVRGGRFDRARELLAQMREANERKPSRYLTHMLDIGPLVLQLNESYNQAA